MGLRYEGAAVEFWQDVADRAVRPGPADPSPRTE
jgi:hypothetical protein